MSLELTGVHGLLKRHKLFTHKKHIYEFYFFVLILFILFIILFYVLEHIS